MEKEEESVAFLDRRSRATRGKRMNKLLDDENEEDELFWNQDALKEEENDGEYEEEGEAVDEFDSDFNDDEPEADEGAENEIDERARPKKRLVYPGKHSLKKKKKKNLSKIEKDIEAEKPSELPTPSEPTHTPDDVEEERIVRKSTRTSVVVRQAERDAIRAALQATMKPIKRKKEGEEKKMSQEEMLLEAAQTVDTGILKQGCHMQQRRPFKFYVNVIPMRMVMAEEEWIWPMGDLLESISGQGFLKRSSFLPNNCYYTQC